MKCPVCSKEMAAVQAGGTVVDVCIAGCGGIFFDNFELERFDEPHESVGALLAHTPSNRSHPDSTARVRCPRCPDIIMMRHYYSRSRSVIIDECPNCGGHWLDAGELERIRQENATEPARVQALETYLRGRP